MERVFMRVGMMVGIKKRRSKRDEDIAPQEERALPDTQGKRAGGHARKAGSIQEMRGERRMKGMQGMQDLQDSRSVLRLRRADIHRGLLILVNAEYPVRLRRMPGGLTGVADAGLLSPAEAGAALNGECLSQLARLITAAEGRHEIAAVSGYRSRQEQEALYEQSLRDNGAAYTASYVALPGRSEHETGLAVDVCRHDAAPHPIAPAFPDEGACLAFKRLAARYGFIQRYRAGKEALTGIACEPWHYRYVGVPHAEWMEELDFCLEEYIDYVRAFAYGGKRFIREQGRVRSEIYYVRANEEGTTDVPLPDCDRWSCSGNNADGFIVTAYWGASDGIGER